MHERVWYRIRGSRNHEKIPPLEKAGEIQLIERTKEAEVTMNRQHYVFSVEKTLIFPKILCVTDDGTWSKEIFALLCVIPMPYEQRTWGVISAHKKMLNCWYCRLSVLMYSCIATPTRYLKEKKRYGKLLQVKVLYTTSSFLLKWSILSLTPKEHYNSGSKSNNQPIFSPNLFHLADLAGLFLCYLVAFVI